MTGSQQRHAMSARDALGYIYILLDWVTGWVPGYLASEMRNAAANGPQRLD
jgi:hypothetical protein